MDNSMFYECKRQFPAAHEEQSYVIRKRVHQNVLQIEHLQEQSINRVCMDRGQTYKYTSENTRKRQSLFESPEKRAA
jgi:hypothetical protein